MIASDSRKPSISTGMRSTMTRVTPATTVPTVVQPASTPQEPTAMTAAIARRGRVIVPAHIHESR